MCVSGGGHSQSVSEKWERGDAHVCTHRWGGRGDSVTHNKGIKSETTGSNGGGSGSGWGGEGSISACNPQEDFPREIKQVIKDIRP